MGVLSLLYDHREERSGIPTVGARRLLAHFGSLPAVFAASGEELRAVAGIGPVRAGTLAWLFDQLDEPDV